MVNEEQLLASLFEDEMGPEKMDLYVVTMYLQKSRLPLIIRELPIMFILTMTTLKWMMTIIEILMKHHYFGKLIWIR